jgi:S-adenosylmethionine:tRNA ribosyltransferase-isomerase
MLCVDRDAGTNQDRAFTDLCEFLSSGDLIVVNDTEVLPARLTARKVDSGGRVEVLLVEPVATAAWRALVRPSSRVKPGTRVALERRGATDPAGPVLVIGEVLEDGSRLVSCDEHDLSDLAVAWGEMPLPPYIDRSDGPHGPDLERYQTLFAATPGAVAAPTAGLHFSEPILERLRDQGVKLATVTLHVGPGTFQPVRSELIGDHAMHSERYCVPPSTAVLIKQCQGRGGRILAVGTTVCRSLESWHREGRPDDGKIRSTALFLRPGHGAELELSLLTNFHLPGSTLLMLVASFLGRDLALSLYRQAAEKGYRFFSYGDSMLIL